MVTKLKEFSLHEKTKLIAAFLAVIAIISTIYSLQLASLKQIDPESLFVSDYRKSNRYFADVTDIMDEIVRNGYRDDVIPNVSYYYCIWNDKKTLTNTDSTEESFYSQFEDFYVLKDGLWTGNGTNRNFSVRTYITAFFNAYLAFPDTYFEQEQQEWEQNRELLLPYIIAGSSFAVLGILLAVFSILTTGKQSKESGVKLYKLDKLYSDLNLLILGSFAAFLAYHLQDILDDNTVVGLRIRGRQIRIFTNFKGDFILSSIFFLFLFLVIISVIFFLLLSLVRKLKAGILIKHSLLYLLIKKTYRLFKDAIGYLLHRSLYMSVSLTKTLYYRQCVVTAATGLLLIAVVILISLENALFILPLLLEIGVLIWYWKGNHILYHGIDSEIQKSLDEQMKSERMKIALITNVSHDLKTPLTSIISYTDLLSKEEGLSQTAADYIRILQAKSDRLKNIVTDLFDLAKSTSGDVTLDFETLDLKKLIEQTLAEMEDRISASKLIIKAQLPDTPVNIYADGKRLYRVFQNIIDNTLKYSMPASRVYLILEESEQQALVTVKNISAQEMNFTAEEILQRFSRGDQARSEEGSGLGLSIAESFTRICKGEFKVEIDGDLFKVIISFPRIKDSIDNN